MIRRFATSVTWLVAVGCGSVKDLPAGQDASPQPDANAGTMADGSIDPPPGPACDVTKQFGTPADVQGIHDPLGDDVHATLSADELTIYFASNRIDQTNMHIYTATRSSRDAAFPTPVVAAGTYSDAGESHPSVSADGNTIYFDSFRMPPTTGTVHIFGSTRANASIEFPTPTALTGDFLIDPSITADGNVLYVANLSTGLLSRMDRTDGGLSPPQTVPLNFLNSVVSPVSSDDLTLFMSLGDTTGNSILVSRRSAVTMPWPTPTPVSELQTTSVLAEPSWISADGCRLYLTYRATVSDKSRILVATRPD